VENARPVPGLKQNIKFTLCGPENVFQCQGFEFCGPETTKLQAVLISKRVFFAV
jgi:hypothetical protein